MAWMSLQFQWPCSVSKLELIFLCQMGRIRRFYGKDVTAASVNLFSVQTGADIPLPPKRNRKILWKKEFTAVSVTLFSVQTGADISLLPKRNRRILWQRCHCNFQLPCSVSNLELIFLCNLGKMEGFCGKEITEVSVTLFSVQSGGDIPLQSGKNRRILWQGCHCSFSEPVQCPNWSWYSFAAFKE